MKDLAAVAAVKEEARGVVITLSGSVLFASGKYRPAEHRDDQAGSGRRGAQGAGRRQTDGRRRPHRQPGLGQGQPASVTEPRQRRARLPGLPRGRLREDHGGGHGLDPADRRQQVGREPRQQPARRDRHQHGPLSRVNSAVSAGDDGDFRTPTRRPPDAPANAALAVPSGVSAACATTSRGAERKNGELVRGNPGGRRRRSGPQRRRRHVSAPGEGSVRVLPAAAKPEGQRSRRSSAEARAGRRRAVAGAGPRRSPEGRRPDGDRQGDEVEPEATK